MTKFCHFHFRSIKTYPYTAPDSFICSRYIIANRICIPITISVSKATQAFYVSNHRHRYSQQHNKSSQHGFGNLNISAVVFERYETNNVF